MFLSETFIELLKDPNHWGFEIVTLIILDGIFLGLGYPLFKKWLANHDRKHHAKECDYNGTDKSRLIDDSRHI